MLRVPRQVLVYVFRRSTDGSVEFLLLRRTREWGGFWQGVSGAPERGETDAEGAIREVAEETGYIVSSELRAIGFRYELLRDDDPDEERWEYLYGPGVDAIPEEVYVAEVPLGPDPILSPYEHEAFDWLTFDEALARLTWENNRRALEAARRFITALD